LDSKTLVRRELEIENLVLNALASARIQVTLCVWNFVPQLDEHQLVIATPLYDSIGPRAANSRVLQALTDAGVYSDIPTRKLFVLSPSDPTVKELEAEVRVQTEGSIHITQEPGEEYSLIFAPYIGSTSGAMTFKRISGSDELRRFLTNRVHIWTDVTEQAIHELDIRQSTSVPHVQLTRREAKRLGLA
jgi:hypothetical protein